MQPQKTLAQLYTLHLALMLIPAVVATIAYFSVKDRGREELLQWPVFSYAAAGLALVAVLFSQVLPRFWQSRDKLTLLQYARFKIAQWVLIEMAALFLAVVLWLTGQFSMLLVIAVLIALMAFLRPSREELSYYKVE
ncbi:MAG: hypothetical protein N2Z22_05835 [Turneriella sp.]|nr:hypothetical protein [Leptospiraceae bacterium]MCX7632834.1 hypothetical protein [Turneriella sp.]